MSSLLENLGRRLGIGRRAGVTCAGLHPEEPVAVVGDIHGRADLLEALLEKIALDAAEARLVFVGDYTDRGPDSRQVLHRLHALGDGAVCLKGNHEVMLLDFLESPLDGGLRWLRHGGVQTLTSFGIGLPEEPSVREIEAARRAFAQALRADGMLAWLQRLPVLWQSGNLLVTHAGPDPALPVAGQEEDVFLWGHPRFLRDARRDGLWVAHGHWVREKAKAEDGRISVDTGAWKSGRLSAAVIRPDGALRFVDVRRGR